MSSHIKAPLLAAQFKPVISLVSDTLTLQDSVVLGIEGDAGAGKTTQAILLQQVFENTGYSVSLIHMDDFFLPFNLKTPKRLACAGENIHYERFLKEVAPALQETPNFLARSSTRYGKFDCSVGKITAYTTLHKSNIYIVEGSYAMNKHLVDLYDITVFMKIDALTQKKRICNRNTPKITERYFLEWIPMEKQFHKQFNLEKKADFVIDCSLDI